MTIGEDIASSYYHVGSIPPETQDPFAIVAYDKAGNHPGERNCLFVDGHVEILSEMAFQERCRENLELLKSETGWEKLSAERRAQIEAFYSGTPTATGEMERIDHALP